MSTDVFVVRHERCRCNRVRVTVAEEIARDAQVAAITMGTDIASAIHSACRARSAHRCTSPIRSPQSLAMQPSKEHFLHSDQHREE